MRLSALISPEVIIDDIEATDREGVLREMVAALADCGRVEKKAVSSIVKALLSREELGSTGIGKRVAVPHAKHESVSGLVAAFGRSRRGVEFAALDGQPVRLVYLLISSKDASGQHLEALARVARIARDDRYCRFLIEAGDKKELEDILREADGEIDNE